MTKASSTIQINAPIKKVFEVVTDFEKYPEFVSNTKQVSAVKKDKTQYDVEFKIEVVKTVTYSLAMVLNAPHEVTWTLIKGDYMKSNNGRWILKEIKKGVTEATYEIEIGFGLLVPTSIATMLIQKNLPIMLGEFKKRVEDGA